jgi:hypothetical protein
MKLEDSTKMENLSNHQNPNKTLKIKIQKKKQQKKTETVSLLLDKYTELISSKQLHFEK